MYHKQTTHEASDGLSGKRILLLSVAVVAVILLAGCAAPSFEVEPSQEEWFDDFEDGTSDGWSADGSTNPTISGESIEGSNSLYAISDDPGQRIVWDDGPLLDMSEPFTVETVFRPNEIDPHEAQIRIGLSGEDPGVEGTNAFILFDNDDGSTYLDTHARPDPPEEDKINDSFDNEWVNIEMESDGEGTLTAKIWEHGTTEPDEPQLERDFAGIAGDFGFNVGTPETEDPQDREAWLDQVNIEGQQIEIDGTVRFNTPALVEHGDNRSYSFEHIFFDNETGGNVSEDVTDNITVISGNEDALTVDEENHTLIATNDTSINERVEVTAVFDEVAFSLDVAVAEIEVENLEVLPPEYRFAALISDDTIMVLLIAIGAGVVGTRWATSFAGLGAAEMVILVGWFGGWIGTGIMMVSVFAALFIGFNLAANVDYSIRR